MNFVLTRTEQILGDSAVPPPPQPVSSSLGANASGRPVRQAARIRRSDMVIDEGESDGNTDSTYQNEEEGEEGEGGEEGEEGEEGELDENDGKSREGELGTEGAEVCILPLIHMYLIKVTKRLRRMERVGMVN